MPVQERNASTGYLALGQQSDQLTAVTPTVFVPYYKSAMMTDIKLNEDTPIMGQRFKTYQALLGAREHKGSVTVQFEANTSAHWAKMFMTQGTGTGSGPYSWPYGLSNNTNPTPYTMDICEGGVVVRYVGVQASKIVPSLQNETWQLEVTLSAISSFFGREIASISTATLTLKTDYDLAPTTGLVVGDLVCVTKADGSSTSNFTISSLTATTVTLNATAAAFAAGDMLELRPATPSYTVIAPFTWGRTQFFFAADASTAATNSSTPSNQTRLEKGTTLSLNFPFEKDGGSDRSGGYDPASLVRTVGDANFKIKKFFDNPDELKYWLANTKRAVVIRMLAGSTGQYESRITLNNLHGKPAGIPTESGGVIYQEIDYVSTYDPSDTQGMAWLLINALATV